jgi:hypothetical protein
MEVKQQKMISELMDQAIETFNAAFKTGIRMNEEMTRWWTDVLSENSPVQNWQKRAQTMMADAVPLAQKTAEEGLRTLDTNYRNSMDFLKKVLDTGQAESLAEAREQTQALWEASLSTLRSNAQELVQTNAKVMETWAEFIRRNIDGKGEGQPEMAAAH